MFLIGQYKLESQKIREKLEKLSSSVTIFQSTKCSACGHTLDLPTVHFLCGHGYHQHCFQSYSDSDSSCPACAPENKKILDMLKSQEIVKTQHDQFHAQLEKAEGDGFGIVAEYLGRGLFDQTKPEKPSKSSTEQSSVNKMMRGLNIDSDLRWRGQDSGGQHQEISEARMRQADRVAGGQSSSSEARLRATEPSEAGVMIPSDARMRLAENRNINNSLKANMTTSPVTRQSFKPMSVSPRVPRREDIVQPNPFKEPASTVNPFGSPDSNESLGDDNPFAKQVSPNLVKTSENPFGEDYDEDMNPFAE